MNKWYDKVSQSAWELLKKLETTDSIRMSPELFAEIEIASALQRLEKHGIKPYQDVFVYNLFSQFSFGKFSNNQLRYVYKIAPEYIEWCISNAEGFIINPVDLEILKKEPVFEDDALSPYIFESGTNKIEIDLSNLKINNSGFPSSTLIREKIFKFSDYAIRKNAEKLKSDISPKFIISGANWEQKIPDINRVLPRTTSIKIIPPPGG